MLIALKCLPDLAIQVRGAINNGLAEVKVPVAILQTTIDCGVPKSGSDEGGGQDNCLCG